MSKRTKVTERDVILFVTDHPGLTTAEIAEQLNCEQHVVARFVRRLINIGEIKIRKQYYAIDWKDMIDWDKIPNEKRPDDRKE